MAKRCFGCMQLKENSPVCEHCGFNENVQNESHQLPMGTVLRQQYMVGKCLGQGGFGITYLGWDLHLDIPVAIKEYYPNSIISNRDTTQTYALTGVAPNMMDLYVSTRQRFLREAKVLAKLRNIPNIVQVHNFFEENNTAYIVMEYVKGIDLRRYMNMRGGRLSVEETLAILRPVMEALARVHDCEIVHRDISPDNIMMMADGTAKLLDFGAVRNIESMDADQDLQHSTEAILKHGFAPMEQYQKRGALGPWTDEYAMCATVYYCLTGRVPPDAPQRMMEDVHPAWEKIPGLSSSQRMVLEKGMSLRGKDRYPNVRELMAALYGPEPQPAAEPIQATKPVQSMEMPPQEPVEEAEVPAYTAPMMTAPVEHVELPAQKKKKSGGLIIAAVALVAALAAGAWMLGGNKSKPQMQAPETQAPAITTEAPETTAPPVTTEATEPLPVWYDNVLMAQTEDSSEDYYTYFNVPVFGTDIPRSQVKTVAFRDSIAGAPADAYDVSEAQDGSVLLWCKDDSAFMKDVIIAADGGINAKYCVNMFMMFNALESVDFGTAFHTDYALDFTFMFHRCDKLEAADFSSFNTRNVTSIRMMFSECPKLTYVNMNGWDMSHVTDMTSVFYKCNNMGNLELQGWDITYVTSYDGFLNKVKTINGKPWEEFFMYRDFRFENDEANAEKPWADNILMAQKLPSRDYHGPDGNVPAFGTNIARGSIQSVTFLDSLSGAPAETWDVSAAQDGGVLAWATLDSATGKYDFYIAGEGGVRAGQCVDLFAEFTSLKTVNFGTAFHVDGVRSLRNMFVDCMELTELDLSEWDVSQVTDMSCMFAMIWPGGVLTDVDVSGWDTSNVTDMSSMFYLCISLTDLNMSGWDVSKVDQYSWFMDDGDTINGQPWEEFFQ